MSSPAAAPTAADRTAGSARRTREQALATGIAGALALILGTIVAALSTVGWYWPILLNAVASPQLLAWLIGVALLALLMRGAPASAFAVLAVAMAPVATLVGILAQAGVAALSWGATFLIQLVWQSAGLIGAALIGAIAGVLYRRRREAAALPAAEATDVEAASDVEAATKVEAIGAEQVADPRRRQGVLAAVSIGLLVIGAALAFVLPTQWFMVYFTLSGEPAIATPADGARYLWTAGSAIAFLVAALVVAIVRRGAGLIVLSSIAVACALIGAFVFQVPQGRFLPQSGPIDDGIDHPVCYGTTGDCPGG